MTLKKSFFGYISVNINIRGNGLWIYHMYVSINISKKRAFFWHDFEKKVFLPPYFKKYQHSRKRALYSIDLCLKKIVYAHMSKNMNISKKIALFETTFHMLENIIILRKIFDTDPLFVSKAWNIKLQKKINVINGFHL